MKWERSNILAVERYLHAHLPKRNKYHLHEAEDLEMTNQKISIRQSVVKDICRYPRTRVPPLAVSRQEPCGYP